MSDLKKLLEDAITISENHVVEDKTNGQLFNDNLPEGVTKEVVEKVKDYIDESSQIFNEVIGTKVINHMNDNPEVDSLGYEMDCGPVSVGFHQTRPKGTKKKPVNTDSVIAGMQSTVTFKSKRTVAETQKNLANLWKL